MGKNKLARFEKNLTFKNMVQLPESMAGKWSDFFENNKSITLADYSIYVPMKTYGMVECIHQIFLHLILDESMEVFEWDRVEFQNMNASNFKL